ncbi:MAG TPA: hypothetical protein PKW56_08825 [Clostridiales bacterium]|nr:hypothetical protein [Clostridiales bacterium]
MNEVRKKSLKGLLKIAAGIAVTTVCPPAGAVIGTAVFLKSAKDYRKSCDPADAMGMVTGWNDIKSADK